MKKIALFFSILLFMGTMASLAQTRVVTGTVTSSEDGQPVPGVSIVVQGTTLGTVSDLDGNYSLQVPQDAENLMFSFVGMATQSVAIGNQSTINVEMVSQTFGVDEVVVTALGTSRAKKSLGYASQGVSGEDITSTNVLNPMSALSGKVAGMQIQGQNFAGSQNILIRGASSFQNNNQPLFVVDGVPVSNENFNTLEAQRGGGGYDYGSMINDLNPHDIASIDVLKGSAASALYGSRGQNGVIMITTKSGRAGRRGFSVEVNSGVSFETVSILPKQQNMYGGGMGDFETVTIPGHGDFQVVYYGMDESWGPKYEGQQVLHWWGAADFEQGITNNPVTAPWVAPENDVRSFYETGVNYQNSVNIVTTSEISAMRLGYTNSNMTGIHPNSQQDKHSFNVNGETSLFDGLIETDANLNVVYSETLGRPQFGYGDNSQSQKFFQWGQRSLDFEKLKDYINPDGTMRTWNRRAWNDPTPVYSDNPYWTAYKNYQDDDRLRVFGRAGVTINLTDYLRAVGNFYYDTYNFNQRERVSIGSQAMSEYHQINRQSTETNTEGKLELNKNLEDFSILAMVGGNIRKENYSRFEGETNGGLVIDGLWNLNNSANSPLLDDFNRLMRVNSLFGSASVGFRDMLYVDGTYRVDWDSTLPEENNKYGYASVSASFIASELLDLPWMDNLKVRANYGETGMGTTPYQVFNVYSIGDPFNGNPTFTNQARLSNQFLLPEMTKEVEVGLEGAFYRNRVGFDFSYYNRNTENQIVPIEVSGAGGYTSRMINAGKINNEGIEILAYGSPVRTNDYSWEVSVNFAKNKNTVLDLPEELGGKIQLMGAPFGGALLTAVEDATFQELIVYNYKFDNEGNKIIGPNGMYLRGELESVGSVLPDYTAGVRNAFRYKNIDASALIDISQGGKYYSLTHMWSMYSGMAAETATPTSNGNTIREDGLVLEGVTEDGQPNTTNIAAQAYSFRHYHGYGTPSATSVFDASYIKLREVTLGYTFPQLFDVLQSVRLSLYGRNLAVWGLDNKGIDPETVVGGSGNIQGLEGGIIPATRSFGFNLRVNL
jgi:TonB-linked SusC/RagA family outer membrane protein